MADSKDDPSVTVKAIKGLTSKGNDEILSVLKSISDLDMTKLANDVDCVDDLYDLLSSDSSDVQVQAAKVIAEITKNSAQRQKFTESKIVKKLLDIIAPTATDRTIQACRALGNIFYENAKARDLMDKEQDIKLYSLLDWKNENGLSEELEKQFVKTRCGLISNYLQSEAIAKRAVELKLITKVQQILKECTEDKHDYLVLHVLPPLSILSEMIDDVTFDPPTTKLIIGILARSSNPDISEVCLELLQCQAENDDFKYLLAKEGLCDILYDLLGKHKGDATTDETKSLMKSACDLIIQVLNGDDAMHHLYSTPFLGNIEKWLDSYDIDLLIAAVLAIGNFARTDTHCIEFVDREIMKKLIEILAKNNSVDDDIRLQHALLSAIRNLVIPKPNKIRLVSDGLIETILPMLESNHQPPVVFKLLGTLRMAVDGQERLAMELLQNDKLIKQLVVWSKNVEYHPGVSAESVRLMAWLLKFAYKNNNTNPEHIDDSSIRKFVQVDDAVKSIVSMLLSNHLVMQNEALIALCILTVSLQSKASNETIKLDRLLIDSDFGQKLADFITKNMDTMTKEIVENLHTLIRQLKQCEALDTYLNQFKINELMNNIPSLTEYCTI